MGIGKDKRMSVKWIGAFCIIAGCGGCGFLMAWRYLVKIRLLQNLINVLDYMECELQYRNTPLPRLCRQAGQMSQGKIQEVFLLMADELDAQVSPDAQLEENIIQRFFHVPASVLERCGDMEKTLHDILLTLSTSLGRFDMQGQLRGLEYARKTCRSELLLLTENKSNRIRSYQTLGLCAGAAIAILFV